MDHEQPSTATTTTPATTPPAQPADARPAWTVQFVAPREKGMPSDRLRARAELVKAATGCDCGSSY